MKRAFESKGASKSPQAKTGAPNQKAGNPKPNKGTPTQTNGPSQNKKAKVSKNKKKKSAQAAAAGSDDESNYKSVRSSQFLRDQADASEDPYGFPSIDTELFVDYDAPPAASTSATAVNADGTPKDADEQAKDEETSKSELKKKRSGGFQSMDLSKEVFRAIMKKGFKVPTPIQRKTIPHVLGGKDVVAMARTGSGKTAAFVIPMLEKLVGHSPTAGVRAVVLSPTRELCQQTERVVREMARFTDLQTALLIGGESMEAQFAMLSKCPDIIIAAPGRLVHLLLEVKEFSLKTVQYLVFDEADRLFEMGFGAQINALLRHMPDPARQTLLFSATMPTQLAEFSRAGLRDPITVRLDAEIKIPELLRIFMFTCRSEEKIGALMHILRKLIPDEQQAIIFVSTRQQVDWICSVLTLAHFTCAPVYGRMDQFMRNTNVTRFRTKKARLLVVTDVAARGIDIPMLDNVVNFDFPPRSKLFLHRVGRVARNGRPGTAYSLASPDELAYLCDTFMFLDKVPKCTATAPYNSDDPKQVYYGRIPSHLFDSDIEFVNRLHIDDSELSGQRESMTNSLQMYVRTRHQASTQSVRQAKRLDHLTVHPLFASNYGEQESKRDDLLSQMKSFRPNTTIFELGAPSQIMRSKRDQDSLAIHRKKLYAAHVPLADRATDAQSDAEEEDGDDIDGEHEQENESDQSDVDNDGDEEYDDDSDDGGIQVRFTRDDPIDKTVASLNAKADEEAARASGTYVQPTVKRSKLKSCRDEKFFVSALPARNAFQDSQYSLSGKSEIGERLDDMVLDMGGDDGKSRNKTDQPKRSVLKWDRKKKKYVREMVGGDSAADVFKMKKMKDSHGNLIEKKAGELYEKWQKKTRKAVPVSGSSQYEHDSDNDNSGFPASKKVNMDFGFGENDGARWSGALDFGKSKKEPRDGKSNKRGRDDDDGAMERPSKMQKGRNGKAMRSELRAPEVIRKDRHQKAKRASFSSRGGGGAASFLGRGGSGRGSSGRGSSGRGSSGRGSSGRGSSGRGSSGRGSSRGGPSRGGSRGGSSGGRGGRGGRGGGDRGGMSRGGFAGRGRGGSSGGRGGSGGRGDRGGGGRGRR